MKRKKELKEIAKRDTNRFCRRNRVYETYDGSVADMIEKLYVTTYLRARHQIESEINQKTPEEAFESAKGFPNNLKIMKWERYYNMWQVNETPKSRRAKNEVHK